MPSGSESLIALLVAILLLYLIERIIGMIELSSQVAWAIRLIIAALYIVWMLNFIGVIQHDWRV